MYGRLQQQGMIEARHTKGMNDEWSTGELSSNQCAVSDMPPGRKRLFSNYVFDEIFQCVWNFNLSMFEKMVQVLIKQIPFQNKIVNIKKS